MDPDGIRKLGALKAEHAWSILDNDAGIQDLFQYNEDELVQSTEELHLNHAKTAPAAHSEEPRILDAPSIKRVEGKLGFFDLPAELRMEIYTLMCNGLEDGERRKPNYYGNAPWPFWESYGDCHHTFPCFHWNGDFQRLSLVSKTFRYELLGVWAEVTTHSQWLDIKFGKTLKKRSARTVDRYASAGRRWPIAVLVDTPTFAHVIWTRLRQWLLYVDEHWGVARQARTLVLQMSFAAELAKDMAADPNDDLVPLEILQSQYQPQEIIRYLECIDGGILHPDFRLEVDIRCMHRHDSILEHTIPRARRKMVFSQGGNGDWVCVDAGAQWVRHIIEQDLARVRTQFDCPLECTIRNYTGVIFGR